MYVHRGAVFSPMEINYNHENCRTLRAQRMQQKLSVYSKSTVRLNDIYLQGLDSWSWVLLKNRYPKGMGSGGLPLHWLEGVNINWLHFRKNYQNLCFIVLSSLASSRLQYSSKILLENVLNQFIRCCFLFPQASILLSDCWRRRSWVAPCSCSIVSCRLSSCSSKFSPQL